MMLGLLLMPAGPSHNPSRLYQATLVVLLYLPTLVLLLRRGCGFWHPLWPQPAFLSFLALLAWATLSLAWTAADSPLDAFGRILSVALFVCACQLLASERPQCMCRLLTVIGCGMAACALGYSLVFLSHHGLHSHGDPKRINATGVAAAPNYAAAVMGAVCVWLTQLPQAQWGWRMAQWLAVAAALGFTALTQTRGVWLALAACALLAPLWQHNRKALLLAVGVAVLALAALVWPPPALVERGSSLRPQLLMQALDLIAEHPWCGLGQSAAFIIDAGGQHLTHSHNLLTQTAIQLGLPGLIALLLMWAMVAWSAWTCRAAPLGRVTLGLWVYASVALQLDMPQLLDGPRPGWLLIWLPLALALALRSGWPARADERHKPTDGRHGQLH